MLPSISIITPVYNGAMTIADCIRSVQSQSYPAEHIIVDGCSTDYTIKIVKDMAPSAYILSEPDEGMYDAMNKGISLANGDIIGIMNADDYYVNNQVLSKIVKIFHIKNVDSVFADLVFVKPENLNKIVRFYRGSDFSLRQLSYGWMPPHPTFFVKREIYEKYGRFKTNYKIAADFEILARFFYKHKITFYYLPEVIVKMRTGGVSTRSLKSNWILN